MDDASFLRLLHTESSRVDEEALHAESEQRQQAGLLKTPARTKTSDTHAYFACGPVGELKSMCTLMSFKYCSCVYTLSYEHLRRLLQLMRCAHRVRSWLWSPCTSRRPSRTVGAASRSLDLVGRA